MEDPGHHGDHGPSPTMTVMISGGDSAGRHCRLLGERTQRSAGHRFSAEALGGSVGQSRASPRRTWASPRFGEV